MWRWAVVVSLWPATLAAQDWSDVGPVFQDRCVVCHSGDLAPLGLQLDSYENALLGSWNGAVLVAGNPEGSPLARRIRGEVEPRMPMDGPPWLSDAEIALIEDWIAAGLPEGTPDTAPEEGEGDPRPETEVWFQDVDPIFKQRCVKCHSEGSVLGAPPEGLRLSSLDQVLVGGERVVIVPGNPEMSLVWRHAAGLEEPRMPFDGPPFLTAADIALIHDWIAGGARDTEGQPADMPVGRELRVEGVLTGTRELDGAAFVVSGDTRVEDGFAVGGRYELRAVVGPKGEIIADRLRAR